MEFFLKYYHRIFSRYFPRKLRRRMARRAASLVGANYPPAGEAIEDIHELIPGESTRALAFIAHPDDETFCSGLLCRLRKEGMAATLCCLTRGEGGFTGDHPREVIGEVREDELRRAARILGIDRVRFLDHVDPAATDYRTFAPSVSDDDLVDQVYRVLQEERPRLVITHGSCGEYWHPAHILLHDAVRQAVIRWNRFNPEAARMITFNAWDPHHPLPNIVNESDSADLCIDATRFQETRLEALAAHDTQKEVFEIFSGGRLEDFIRLTVRESYHLVH